MGMRRRCPRPEPKRAVDVQPRVTLAASFAVVGEHRADFIEWIERSAIDIAGLRANDDRAGSPLKLASQGLAHETTLSVHRDEAHRLFAQSEESHRLVDGVVALVPNEHANR